MDYTTEGFVNLEKIYKNWPKLINKIIIPNTLCGPHYNGYWLKIDNQTYFLKIPNPYYNKNSVKKEMFCELLSEELARLIGIQTIESNLAMLNPKRDFYGILSKSYLKSDESIYSGKQIVENYINYIEGKKDPLTKENTFKEYFHLDNKESMYDKVNDGTSEYYYNSLEFIWASLDYHFRDYKNKKEIVSGIMQKITKRYIFQFILMQQDFHLANWEIAQSKTSAYLLPQYDMDMSFSSNIFELNNNNSMRSFMSKIDNIYEDIKRFYSSSSDEFKGEFKRQINLLNEEVIEECINKISKQYNMPINNLDLTIYSKHRNRLLEVIKESKKER